MEYKKDYPLLKNNTFQINARSKYYTEISNIDELKEAIVFSKNKGIKYYIIGGGSKILFSDLYNGLIIKNNIREFYINNNEIIAGSGNILDELCIKSIKHNLSGLEYLSGIPGTLGGAIIQNAGCYGQEIGNLVKQVWALDTNTFKMHSFNKKGCEFIYRNSYFKKNGNYFIYKVSLKFQNKLVKPKYESLVRILEGSKLNSKLIREKVIELRKNNSTIYNKNDFNSISAGCYFLNPVIKKEHFEKIQMNYTDIPYWETLDGIKLSGGWLIEKTKFYKGYKNKKVGISEKNALVIINYNNAKTQDIIDLEKEIVNEVYNKFNINLEKEVIYV